VLRITGYMSYPATKTKLAVLPEIWQVFPSFNLRCGLIH